MKRILLINVPSRKGAGGVMVPMGLLYLGSIIERTGNNAKIIDPYLEDYELKDFDSGNFQSIDKVVEDYKPDIIGFGGIGSSYGRTKKLALHIKSKYPDVLRIAGGSLSSVYKLLLTKGGIDLVFHGETEVSFPIFLSKYEKKETYIDTPGISYVKKGQVVRNPLAEQIKDLDSVPLPAYHLIDLPKYFVDVTAWLESYKRLLKDGPRYSKIAKQIGANRYALQMTTSRGCTHACLFCYRHVKGIRQHSVDYVIKHIKFLKENYALNGFQFSDELFNSNNEWVMEFCDALDREKLCIFYYVGGARIDKVNEKMLRRLAETGCVEINYGHESGSDAILKEYRKGVTAKQNRDVTRLTREMGMNCPVQIVIGSPGETDETIKETINFLKDLDSYIYSINYLIPFPETPIWKSVEEKQLIPDVEKYLDQVADEGGRPLVNLTGVPDRAWRGWVMKIRKEMRLQYYKKKKPLFYFPIRFFYLFEDTVLFIDRKHRIKKLIPQRVKSALAKAI